MLVGMVTPVVAGGHIKDILIIQSPEFHFNDTGGFVPGGQQSTQTVIQLKTRNSSVQLRSQKILLLVESESTFGFNQRMIKTAVLLMEGIRATNELCFSFKNNMHADFPVRARLISSVAGN